MRKRRRRWPSVAEPGNAGISTKHTAKMAVSMAVGRVKDTIVLSGGENIEPVPIENAMKESEYIDTAVVVGQDEKYLGALIVINEKNVERYGHQGIHFRQL